MNSSVNDCAPPRASKTRTPTVLCIDDDPDISRTIELRLANYDVEVLRNFTGTQGIWQAVQSKPDLIITDLRMPQGDGEYLLECLKQNQSTAGIPVMVLSGKREQAAEKHALRLGAAGFLRKPVHFHELIDEIKKHVELREID